MRRLGIVLLFLLLVAAPTIIAYAADGTQGDPYLAPNARALGIAFDNTYGSTVIVRAEFVIQNETGTEVARFTIGDPAQFPQGDAVWRFGARAHLMALPNDALYQMRASVTDVAGNDSEWSDPCWFRKEFRVVPPPGGCRLEK